jgi:hypothetical protein
MKRSQLVQISDLVVLASIVAILGSLSVVVAALLVGALGLWWASSGDRGDTRSRATSRLDWRAAAGSSGK